MSDLFDNYLGRLDTLIAVISAVAVVASWLLVSLHRVARGRPERRYGRWFVERYSTYWNPYLNKTEKLRLDRTYVPLSFVDDHSELEDPTIATTAIADRSVGNIIIVGDAGSGKTTMLQAYGVSVLAGRRADSAVASVDRSNREVPFFVPVRMLATALQRGGLAQYLKAEVLGAGAALTSEEATKLLAQLLRQRRCVILLDGLDEVTRQNYQAVREEVYRFARDRSAEMPTANARLVITSRRHNFLRIREDWVAGPGQPLSARVYALAPLRDEEIVGYLYRLRDRFTRPDGPEHFMAAMRASDTVYLHRTPLVLSMSVGLYAGREFFEIPHSIAELYDTMIREMLNRHAFLHGEDRSAVGNEFRGDDKLRMLRELSLKLAWEAPGFGPFRLESMVGFARELQPKLLNVPADRVEAFVDEIIERSGLLSPVSDNVYEFAHRSIQEHMVAAELLRTGEVGTRQLRARAADRDWRQVVVFYTAAADQRVVSPLLTELAMTDPVLAGGALAGADCLDADALPILDRLAATLRLGDPETLQPAMAALLSATTSPRPTIQNAAMDLIYDSLAGVADQSDAVSALGGDVEAVLGMVTMLVDRASQAPMSRTLVSRLIAIIPDDPRLVEPLWRCITDAWLIRSVDAGARAEHPVDRFVERLLTLAMDPACFDELQRQPRRSPAFATPDRRRRAYPFRNGLDPSSNLVTLLCWAEELGIDATHTNRFLIAKATDRTAWARIETDRRRKGFSVLLPRAGLHVTSGNAGRKSFGFLLSAVAVIVAAVVVADMRRPASVLSGASQVGALVLAFAELAVSVPMLGLRVGIDPRRRRLRLFQPNPFVDAYDDPRSRHWLLPTGDTPGER